MKAAILANDQPGFIKPMAAGLQKMLRSLGNDADVFPEGLAMLNYGVLRSPQLRLKNKLKSLVNLAKPAHFLLQQHVSWFDLRIFENKLAQYDVIIVVCNIPDSFLANKLPGVERLRQKVQRPVVLYQNYYLATRGAWHQKIISTGGNTKGYGLERYDWYLAASVVSEYPLSKQAHPYSLIGQDLRDASLVANTKPTFKVLLDFERKGFEQIRQLQIQVLEQANIEYTQLKGRYSPADIRQLYRQHSAFFLSFRESFGLPIVENQLCGSYIFTPFKNWAPSHYINKSLHVSGEGDLGDNFMVYGNKSEKLRQQLLTCQANHQAEQNEQRFQAQYPALYQGDLTQLKNFVAKLSRGKINCTSHLQHHKLNLGING